MYGLHNVMIITAQSTHSYLFMWTNDSYNRRKGTEKIREMLSIINNCDITMMMMRLEKRKQKQTCLNIFLHHFETFLSIVLVPFYLPKKKKIFDLFYKKMEIYVVAHLRNFSNVSKDFSCDILIFKVSGLKCCVSLNLDYITLNY